MPTHSRDNRENANLPQGLDPIKDFSIHVSNPILLRKHDKRVVVAQRIVDIDAEDALAMLLLLVEVGHQVETLVAVVAVIVAALNVINDCWVVIAVMTVFAQSMIALQRQCGAVARAVDPGGTYVDVVVDVIHQHDVQVVATVVFGGEHFAEIQFLALAVEETVGMGPGITNPSGEFAHLLLGEQLNAV